MDTAQDNRFAVRMSVIATDEPPSSPNRSTSQTASHTRWPHTLDYLTLHITSRSRCRLSNNHSSGRQARAHGCCISAMSANWYCCTSCLDPEWSLTLADTRVGFKAHYKPSPSMSSSCTWLSSRKLASSSAACRLLGSSYRTC